MERKQLLKQLVHSQNYRQAQEGLKKLPYDCEEELYVISDDELRKRLVKFEEVVQLDEVEDWANFIECRDDIDFESDRGKELVEKLANPELYGTAKQIIAKFI